MAQLYLHGNHIASPGNGRREFLNVIDRATNEEVALIGSSVIGIVRETKAFKKAVELDRVSSESRQNEVRKETLEKSLKAAESAMDLMSEIDTHFHEMTPVLRKHLDASYVVLANVYGTLDKQYFEEFKRDNTKPIQKDHGEKNQPEPWIPTGEEIDAAPVAEVLKPLSAQEARELATQPPVNRGHEPLERDPDLGRAPQKTQPAPAKAPRRSRGLDR